MKKLIVIFSVCALYASAATADYYRATGGGRYELFVDDCSATGMQAALDRATAEHRAVVTVVKCAAPRNTTTRTSANARMNALTPTVAMDVMYLCAPVSSCACI